jgi:hypothetical protein
LFNAPQSEFRRRDNAQYYYNAVSSFVVSASMVKCHSTEAGSRYKNIRLRNRCSIVSTSKTFHKPCNAQIGSIRLLKRGKQILESDLALPFYNVTVSCYDCNTYPSGKHYVRCTFNAVY